MAWPGDLGTISTAMVGTTRDDTASTPDGSDDHALMHRKEGSILNALPSVFGTSNGTNVLRNIASASDSLAAINSGGTLLELVTGGTANNMIFGSPSVTGGTYNSGIFGTPSVDIISARNGGTGVGFGNSIYPAEGTLVDVAGGTLTADARSAQIYYSVMGTAPGNRTISTPLNISSYQQLTYAFKTSGSANGTLVWGTIFRVSQDSGTPTLGTGVGWNYFAWRYNTIDSKFDFGGQSKNLV